MRVPSWTDSAQIFSAQVEQVFDGVVGEIESLVSQQVHQVRKKIKRNPEYVILAGGFGRCKYLYKRLFALLRYNETKVLQVDGTKP